MARIKDRLRRWIVGTVEDFKKKDHSINFSKIKDPIFIRKCIPFLVCGFIVVCLAGVRCPIVDQRGF
ncbi:MAG: hypothetical protein WCG06_00740 [Candidatus Omnitrophota bacterium]